MYRSRISIFFREKELWYIKLELKLQGRQKNRERLHTCRRRSASRSLASISWAETGELLHSRSRRRSRPGSFGVLRSCDDAVLSSVVEIYNAVPSDLISDVDISLAQISDRKLMKNEIFCSQFKLMIVWIILLRPFSIYERRHGTRERNFAHSLKF